MAFASAAHAVSLDLVTFDTLRPSFSGGVVLSFDNATGQCSCFSAASTITAAAGGDVAAQGVDIGAAAAAVSFVDLSTFPPAVIFSGEVVDVARKAGFLRLLADGGDALLVVEIVSPTIAAAGPGPGFAASDASAQLTAFGATVIPAPAAGAMLGGALIVAGWALRRRRA